MLVLFGAMACAQAPTPADLEARVADLERASDTRPWSESAALLNAITPLLDAASLEQRTRVDLVRLRNLMLAGDSAEALAGYDRMLAGRLDARLRAAVLAAGAEHATDAGDYLRAFTYLREGMDLTIEAQPTRALLLAAASRLYALAGEPRQSLTLAEQALAQVDREAEPRTGCRALATLAAAQQGAGMVANAEQTRRRQIDACARYGDVLRANLGSAELGNLLHAQGREAEALAALRVALSGLQRFGYELGVARARVAMGQVLFALGDLRAARAGMLQAAPVLSKARDWDGLYSVHATLADIAERGGDLASALRSLRLAESAYRKSVARLRDRSLAVQQVEFDKRLQSKRIAALEVQRENEAARAASSDRWLIWVGGGAAVLGTFVFTLAALLRRARRAERRFRWLAERDGLTRTYNQQRAYALGELAFVHARRTAAPFTVVRADVDRFRAINDRYGHAMGDAVLEAIGECWRESFPTPDVVGRIGGESFIAFVHADREETMRRVERLRRHLPEVARFGHMVSATMSFGVCVASPDLPMLDDLLRGAGAALQRARARGNDQTQVYAGAGVRTPAE